MPAADIGLELLNAYKVKRRQNPLADRATLFKYLLWDRFQGKMILDAEIEDMAANAAGLSELALAVLMRERPHLDSPETRRSAARELERFFRLNAPDQA